MGRTDLRQGKRNMKTNEAVNAKLKYAVGTWVRVIPEYEGHWSNAFYDWIKGRVGYVAGLNPSSRRVYLIQFAGSYGTSNPSSAHNIFESDLISAPVGLSFAPKCQTCALHHISEMCHADACNPSKNPHYACTGWSGMCCFGGESEGRRQSGYRTEAY